MKITLIGLEKVPGLVVRVSEGGKVEVDASRARVIPESSCGDTSRNVQAGSDLTPQADSSPSTR